MLRNVGYINQKNILIVKGQAIPIYNKRTILLDYIYISYQTRTLRLRETKFVT
jgi:hypothetical protein